MFTPMHLYKPFYLMWLMRLAYLVAVAGLFLTFPLLASVLNRREASLGGSLISSEALR